MVDEGGDCGWGVGGYIVGGEELGVPVVEEVFVEVEHGELRLGRVVEDARFQGSEDVLVQFCAALDGGYLGWVGWHTLEFEQRGVRQETQYLLSPVSPIPHL